MGRAGKLTSADDIRRTYAEGRRASEGAIVAHVRIDPEARPPRVGITAARGLRGAVERNRAKRRVREAVRILRPEVRPGADVIVVASGAANSGDFQELVTNVRRAVARAGGCM